MANIKKSAPKLKADETAALEGFDTTSAKVRYLNSKSYARADIARILNIRYQWVRGVLETPLKK